MKKILEPGITGTSEITVSEDMLACRVGSGLVEVFSTAMMIAWMEATAVALVQDALPEGMTTVGTRVDVAHVAATPCGMNRQRQDFLVAQGADKDACCIQLVRPEFGHQSAAGSIPNTPPDKFFQSVVVVGSVTGIF